MTYCKTEQNAIRALKQFHQSTADMSAFAGPCTTFPYLQNTSYPVRNLAGFENGEQAVASYLPCELRAMTRAVKHL